MRRVGCVLLVATACSARSYQNVESLDMTLTVDGLPKEGDVQEVAAAAAVESHVQSSGVASGNPLLHVPTSSDDFPRFVDVRAEHVGPACKERLQQANAGLTALESALEGKKLVGYLELFNPLQKIGELVSGPLSVLHFIRSVKDNEGLRKAEAEWRPKVTAFYQKLSQSKAIYGALVALSEGNKKGTVKLTEAQDRAVASELRSCEWSGVGLKLSERTAFNERSQRLLQLSDTFRNHLMDQAKAFHLRLDSSAAHRLQGVPHAALAFAAARAAGGKSLVQESAGQGVGHMHAPEEEHGGDEVEGGASATKSTGPWDFSLDSPQVGALLAFADDRSLREEVYTALQKKGVEGEWDNRPVVAEMLHLRQKNARALGFDNYAAQVMTHRMATLDTASALLKELQVAATPKAKADLAELQAFAKDQQLLTSKSSKTAFLQKDAELQAWDVPYASRLLRQHKFKGMPTGDALRPFFPLEKTLDGLFKLTHTLFGAKLSMVDVKGPWVEGVRLVKVQRESGEDAGYIFLDLFMREGKQSGGWMTPFIPRSKLMAPPGEKARLPVCMVVMNAAPPAPGLPSTLSLGEVSTLFHESGHALQHVLTTQDDAWVAGGAGVEWDAIELPSQFMEYFLRDRNVIKSISAYSTKAATAGGKKAEYKEGEMLPDSILAALEQAQNFRVAATTLGQVFLSRLDLETHMHGEDGEKQETVSALRARETALGDEVLVSSQRYHSQQLPIFGHVFAGGYAAGYYSYKWAEVLSADAFSAFQQREEGGSKEVHLLKEAELKVVGRRFAATVLAQGGGRKPERVFEDFRGRAPTAEALLRYSALA